MNLFDERLKGAFGSLLAGAGIDTRRLSIEVSGGVVTITGAVPNLEQRRLLWSLLASADTEARGIDCRVGVPAPDPIDAASVDMAGDGASAIGMPSRPASA